MQDGLEFSPLPTWISLFMPEWPARRWEPVHRASKENRRAEKEGRLCTAVTVGICPESCQPKRIEERTMKVVFVRPRRWEPVQRASSQRESKRLYGSCVVLFYRKRLPQQNGDRRIGERETCMHLIVCRAKVGARAFPSPPHAIRRRALCAMTAPPLIVYSHGQKSVTFRKSG